MSINRVKKLAGLNESLLENVGPHAYCVFIMADSFGSFDPDQLHLFELESEALDFMMDIVIKTVSTEANIDMTDIYEKFPKIERLKERTYEELADYLEDIEDEVGKFYAIDDVESTGLFSVLNSDFRFFRKEIK